MHFRVKQKDGSTREVGHTVRSEFRKRVRRSKHFLQKPPAIAIEAEVFDQLRGVTVIRVKDMETDEYWQTPFEVFDQHKFEVARGGFGKQYALTLEWWDVFTFIGLEKQKKQARRVV